MNKHIRFILLIALFINLAAYASTTERMMNHNFYNVGRGDLELDFKMNASFYNENSGLNIFTFQVGGNYFMSKSLAPGVELFVQDINGGSQFRILPNLKLYLPDMGRLLPYAQVGLGITNVPGSSGLDFRLGAGLNYLLTRSVAIGFAAQYDVIAADNPLHRFEIPIGFHVYFKY